MFLEAINVGLITVIIGSIVITIIEKIDKKEENSLSYTYKYIINFIVGVLIYLVCENTGLNKIYCNKKCQEIQSNNNDIFDKPFISSGGEWLEIVEIPINLRNTLKK